ncbi:MAG: hypothetical protein EBX52_02155 [Proteobacteria bacterium]|nr:hypothetical protein [Pseudomonadota bacterium]
MKVFTRVLLGALIMIGITSCDATTGTQETLLSVSPDTHPYAIGVRGVKVVTSDDPVTGSFAAPTGTPVPVMIPQGFPGYDGSSLYLPGVSALHYFDPGSANGTLLPSKPDWLKDVQLGITDYPGSGSSTCATFGRTGISRPYDVDRYYRISERDCNGVNSSGTNVGGTQDQAFIRIILNRDPAYLGTRENILIQIEYQATGIRFNPDPTTGTGTNPEDNVDQLWKLFWYSSLNQTTVPTPFSIFVPPVYMVQQPVGGTGPYPVPGFAPGQYGAPITTRQILVPVSAYSNQSVIQLSRVRGRIDDTGGDTYIDSFNCGTDSPLCLGLVIRSVTLLRL